MAEGPLQRPFTGISPAPRRKGEQAEGTVMPTMVMMTTMVMVPPLAMVHVMHKRELAAGINGGLRNRCRRCSEGEACRRDCGNDSMPYTHKLPSPLLTKAKSLAK